MKPVTKKEQQWLWFAALWIGGIVMAWLLAGLAKLVVSIG
jgi:hypothetical protein